MLQGIVTSINVELCSFTLENNVMIYLPHLILNKHVQGLPEIGEHVNINDHYHQASNDLKCIFLCEKSSIKYHRSCPVNISRCYLLQVMKKYQLGVFDILEMNQYVEVIKNHFSRLTISVVYYTVVLILEKLAEVSTIQIMSDCFQRKFPECSLQTICDCQYVNASNEKYSEFPYWSFGVHHRNTPSDILIGYFFISSTHGIPFIKDDKHLMPCCIITHNNKDLVKIKEKLILIRKCWIFTEIFNEPNVVTMEYLVCYIEDICVLSIPPHMLRFTNDNDGIKFYDEKPAGILTTHTLEFVLLTKSSIVSTDDQQPQGFLKILVLNSNSNHVEYLAINSLHIMPVLDIGSTYVLHHNKNLTRQFCGELQRVQQPNENLYILSESSAIFTRKTVIENHINITENIWTVDEVEELIKSSDKMLSFQGIIHAKEFVKRLDSRTATDCAQPGFGTLGNKGHTLHFLNSKDDSTKLLLYINNRENISMPLGLLPGMRLLVRNVLPQKCGYLKCTVLTTFTLLGYEPPVYFDTINLLDNFYGFGQLSYLGSGQDIPSSVLVKAIVFDIQIQSLCINCNCKNCKEQMPCSCDSPELNAQVSVSLMVNGQEGPAFVVTKSLSVLKIVLGLNDFLWSVFLKILHLLPVFNYNECVSKDLNTILLHEILQYSLDTWYSVSLTNLEMICRKLESKPEENDRLPMWYCVHAKLLHS